jgi:DNA-binding NtrC family response regulator
MLDHFLRHFAEIHRLPVPHLSEEAAAQVSAAEWRGNVRQLRNIAERLVVRNRTGVITPADLPREILSMASVPAAAMAAPSTAEVLFKRMVQDGETFWKVVYEPFMSRDITRDDVRTLIRQAMDLTHGNYKSLAQLFNVPLDYKRLLNFLRKYQCHLPIQDFRSRPLRVTETPSRPPLPRAASE